MAIVTRPQGKPSAPGAATQKLACSSLVNSVGLWLPITTGARKLDRPSLFDAIASIRPSMSARSNPPTQPSAGSLR